MGVGADQACTVQLEHDADLDLILGQLSKIADNHQVLAVETRENRFQSEIAAVDLKLLDEIGRSGEDAPVILLEDGIDGERPRPDSTLPIWTKQFHGAPFPRHPSILSRLGSLFAHSDALSAMSESRLIMPRRRWQKAAFSLVGQLSMTAPISISSMRSATASNVA